MLPNKENIKNLMTSLVDELYLAWKTEMSNRLLHLMLKGEIYIQDPNLNVSETSRRLPNKFVRYALSKLEKDLVEQGFECQFSFDDVETSNWCLSYTIELSDDDEYDEDEK